MKTFLVGFIPLFFLILSCGKDTKEVVDISFDKENSYRLRTTDVLTFISDSGIVRYKVQTKEWLIFSDASDPYWYFPHKIYVEKLDSLFSPEVIIKADTAYYFSNRKLFKLIDNVEMQNVEGERFETSLLFFNEKEERFYSDKPIRITKGDFVNTGIGFEANKSLTQYVIFNSGAEIPFEDRSTKDSVAINGK